MTPVYLAHGVAGRTRTILETERLRSGTLIVRPQDSLGTCGWHPKAWTVACVQPREDAVQAWLRVNRNWSVGDLTQT